MSDSTQTPRALFRHTLATLAYRAAKATRGAPPEFAGYKPGPTTRTPLEILAHMGDLLDWGLSMASADGKWHTSEPLPWNDEVARFFTSLKRFDDFLGGDHELGYPLERLFQGPIADALTHTGQLTMLRRMSGFPMKGESYNRADIAIGRVGSDQVPADVKYEFD